MNFISTVVLLESDRFVRPQNFSWTHVALFRICCWPVLINSSHDNNRNIYITEKVISSVLPKYYSISMLDGLIRKFVTKNIHKIRCGREPRLKRRSQRRGQ